MSPRRAGWMACLGSVEDVLTWPDAKLASLRRAGVMVRLRHGTTDAMLFPVQSYGHASKVCDFAGHVEAAEHPVLAAVRELTEESLGVLRRWSTREAMRTAKVYAYLDTLYILAEISGVSVPALIKRFDAARRALPPHAPAHLRETDAIVAVPVADILAQRTHHRPLPVGKHTYSGTLWRSLCALGDTLAHRAPSAAG